MATCIRRLFLLSHLLPYKSNRKRTLAAFHDAFHSHRSGKRAVTHSSSLISSLKKSVFMVARRLKMPEMMLVKLGPNRSLDKSPSSRGCSREEAVAGCVYWAPHSDPLLLQVGIPPSTCVLLAWLTEEGHVLANNTVPSSSRHCSKTIFSGFALDSIF